ncbi:hypothetical protein JKP88DRAFT_245863 [Tribonema minus]|uniref:Uncharacterized protein n=1 Tax=Tribonema minus TaxID=303371 RepID=A0A835YUS5_9STRA|nr:hypothetical protein JKP88DRAFT_245863 [Tribonema minus]
MARTSGADVQRWFRGVDVNAALNDNHSAMTTTRNDDGDTRAAHVFDPATRVAQSAMPTTRGKVRAILHDACRGVKYVDEYSQNAIGKLLIALNVILLAAAFTQAFLVYRKVRTTAGPFRQDSWFGLRRHDTPRLQEVEPAPTS